MSEPLKVVPAANKVKTGVEDTAKIAKALTGVLADTYRLTFKTHAYHWNVEGPLFHSIHILTEGQYEDMFAAADELAERIRALGELAPASMAAITSASAIEDRKGKLSARDMVEDLANDHQSVARRLHEVAEIAEAGRDVVTADLVTARAAFHEKAAWMLNATAAE